VGSDGNRDGLPTVLLEALALGTPAVSTPVTGIPELIRDGDTGLLVGQHDPPALARALTRLLDDAGLRERLSVAGRALVEREFDADRSAAARRAVAWPAAARAGTPAREPRFAKQAVAR
jgi:colanic acid/amylovoran biosynthesis glycosyltransferase